MRTLAILGCLTICIVGLANVFNPDTYILGTLLLIFGGLCLVVVTWRNDNKKHNALIEGKIKTNVKPYKGLTVGLPPKGKH